ncbi:hypothetical protein OHA21_10105 [Actinoplanes sp. NBC_00393]|uniref:hypothetical protein n=1 Tax=Actinoplanes sp. NBC_00393 TaxID=2975953 RepID=UPI002E1C2A28
MTARIASSSSRPLGADGVHSRTRALAFGPEERFVHDLGYRISARRTSSGW